MYIPAEEDTNSSGRNNACAFSLLGKILEMFKYEFTVKVTVITKMMKRVNTSDTLRVYNIFTGTLW